MQPNTIIQTHAASAIAIQNSHIKYLFNIVTHSDDLAGIGDIKAAITTNQSRLEQVETLYRSARAKHEAATGAALICLKATFACLLIIGIENWTGNIQLTTGPLLIAPFLLVTIAIYLIAPTRKIAIQKRDLWHQVRACANLQQDLYRQHAIRALKGLK